MERAQLGLVGPFPRRPKGQQSSLHSGVGLRVKEWAEVQRANGVGYFFRGEWRSAYRAASSGEVEEVVDPEMKLHGVAGHIPGVPYSWVPTCMRSVIYLVHQAGQSRMVNLAKQHEVRHLHRFTLWKQLDELLQSLKASHLQVRQVEVPLTQRHAMQPRAPAPGRQTHTLTPADVCCSFCVVRQRTSVHGQDRPSCCKSPDSLPFLVSFPLAALAFVSGLIGSELTVRHDPSGTGSKDSADNAARKTERFSRREAPRIVDAAHIVAAYEAECANADDDPSEALVHERDNDLLGRRTQEGR